MSMSQDPSEHNGRVAVVTGGSSGIGNAIADRLQREGASVTIMDLVPGAGGAKLQSSGSYPPISFYQVDVAKERDVAATFKSVSAREGKIDYLVCCAAIFHAAPFLQLSGDEWRRTLDINLNGAFLCCREAIRLMRSRRFGRIILFSSMLARTGGINSAHYSASKGGVLGLARSLALEVAGENIRVNTISPGLTDTPQPRGHLSDEELYGRGASIPLGRIGSVEDMVEGCLFLLSEDSAYFTGQDLRINGGASLW
jgi:NAD(P)-dependent dehydrogenase (short-subunit alcohol dehydrogenase family)